MTFDITAVRSRFPALAREEDGRPVAYLDGPAGTQVPVDVIEATAELQRRGVGNLGGPFGASRDAGTVTSEARSAMADLFNGARDEIVFGQNMTSLTFAVSRAIAREWSAGDRILVTALDHDANRTPWMRAAAEAGVAVDEVGFDPDSGALDPGELADSIAPRTRLVAVTAASNAIGSVSDLAPIVAAAHSVGALVYVDAVHYSAHRLNDVAALGADFLVASAYKFFGPHTGIMWGRQEHLERLEAYKVIPAPGSGPGKWETGTQAFESLVAVTAAVEYLASLGTGATRRERLEDAFAAIGRHEDRLTARFAGGLAELPGVTLHGPGPEEDRVSTFAVTVEGRTPQETARLLGERGIHTWSGDYYAIRVMEHLGLAETGGAVRIGFVHYTSEAEVDRVLQALDEIS
jgi:cysteine desulfurase family protein (TIGR01976 family)